MNQIKLFVLINFVVCGLIFDASAQEKAVSYLWDASNEMQNCDIELQHLNAELIIKPFDTLVAGKAEFTFRTFHSDIDSIEFSVPELNISEIKINNRNTKFRIAGNEAIIYLPFKMAGQTSYFILFEYTSKPKEGLYFIGWNDPNQLKRKQIWAHRPDHWLPYKAGIITVNMAVTTDDKYKVFSNGVREKIVKNGDHTQTWYYKMNHPNPFFSTSLVIGDYDFVSMQTNRGLPLELWYYPDWKDHVEPTFRFMPEMFDYFESEFGLNYPWELYREAPVSDYMYGAMETTTSTIFGDYLAVDQRGYLGRNYVNVNAHELAHQWFGDYISHLRNKDVWITESFATYWAKKFEKYIFGDDYYQNVRNQELRDVMEASAHDNYPVGHSSGGRNRWYPKGSLVLDMLREIMGDYDFRFAIKYYLESHPYKVAETNDFLADIRKSTGKSLEWFFDEWILKGGEPFYEIRYQKITNETGTMETRISVEQIHKTDNLIGLFKMPFEFEVHYNDGTFDAKKQWISAKYEVVIVPNPAGKAIDFVLFDPNRKVLKNVKFDRSFNELSAQALHAANMIDRFDAMIALRDYPIGQKKEALLKCYQNETFHLAKGEIIAQLSVEKSPECLQLLTNAINDPDDKVRLAVLQNVLKVPFELKESYEKMLADSSFLNIELALSNLCNSFPGECKKYLNITKNETGWRGRNIRIKWLEISINNGNNRVLDELKKYTGESFEFETRINSMNALKRLNILDEVVIKNMLQGLTHWNYKIKAAASETLKYFYTQDKYKALIDKAIEEGISDMCRLEINKIIKVK